jgi:hypothetical protein
VLTDVENDAGTGFCAANHSEGSGVLRDEALRLGDHSDAAPLVGAQYGGMATALNRSASDVALAVHEHRSERVDEAVASMDALRVTVVDRVGVIGSEVLRVEAL